MTTAEYMERLRAELAQRREFPHLEDSYLRRRFRDEADVPESDDLRAMGEHQDAAALRGEDRDPLLDDAPHPGGARWEQLLNGEAGT